MATDKKFEEMMQELEKISQDLEKGDLSLDESMKKFEEGIALSKKCSEIIQNIPRIVLHGLYKTVRLHA